MLHKEFLKVTRENESFTYLMDIKCPKCKDTQVMVCRKGNDGEVLAVSCTNPPCDYFIHEDKDLDEFFDKNGDQRLK